MMSERILAGIEPERVFYYFEEITGIPRPSYKEKAISDYLAGFAKDHSFEYMQDDLGNIIIIRPASDGCEDRDPVIIQCHIDMVCEKEPSCTKDMNSEGLDLFIDGDLIGARDTTLGADNGIGIAIGLALFEDDSLKAPRLELVCTVSEETGMDGAENIDLSGCKAKRFINIDSEEEDAMVLGCAGGGMVEIVLPVERKASGEAVYNLTIEGLLGGHSGSEINKGRANANLLMARLLRKLSQNMDVSLVHMGGGNKSNAIPRRCDAVISISSEDSDALRAIAAQEAADIASIYSQTDPDICVLVDEAGSASAQKALTPEDTRKVIRLLLSLPNGVVRMRGTENQVETSLNLGVLKLSEDELSLTYLLRSNVVAAYDALRENMRFMAEGYEADFRVFSEYPAWEFVRDTPLQTAIRDIYRKRNGSDIRSDVIHAGLECGLFVKKLNITDVVSIGPDISGAHTTQERLSVSSTLRVYGLLKELIETI